MVFHALIKLRDTKSHAFGMRLTPILFIFLSFFLSLSFFLFLMPYKPKTLASM